MKMTSAQANKLLNRLKDDLTYLLTKEAQSRVFNAAVGEDVEATVVLLFLFVFGDAFAQGIVDVYAAILGGRSVDNEALCSFILRILQIVMAVVTAGFSIETLLRIIRNYKRRKHHGSES